MNTYYLHLHREPIALIKSGTKTIENRLYDEKRKLFRVGDTLVFTNRDNDNEKIKVEIIRLIRARNFKELFSNPEVISKSGAQNVVELLNSIEKYYSTIDQDKYGVLCIEFKVI